MTSPTASRTCQNVNPGDTEPCSAPWDGKETGGGSIDCCPECRAACNTIVAAAVAILVERAAQLVAAKAA